jgi:hypothetical protein
MSGTIDLVGPTTNPAAPAISATAVNTAVNAALATKAPVTVVATLAPSAPSVGSLWFDSAHLILSVWTGSAWATVTAAIDPANTVDIAQLPTSSAGLQPGALWLNDGVLTVVR